MSSAGQEKLPDLMGIISGPNIAATWPKGRKEAYAWWKMKVRRQPEVRGSQSHGILGL